jgi:TetR/AcrR family transcriptional regulator, repressor of fatR-cypB operon
MSALQLSRKEREKQARQQDILAAAQELFLHKGYHETTLEEIARHADFGKGTIYNYFNSKEELFHAISSQLIDKWEALARTAMEENEGDCRQKLFNYARQVILHARDNSDVIRLVMRRAHQLESKEHCLQMSQFGNLMQRILKIIAQPLRVEQERKKVKSIDPMVLAMLFDGMVRAYCFSRFGPWHALEEQEIDADAETIVTIFFSGISLDQE